MKKPTKPASAGMSGAALARLYGINERTVRKLADDGILVRLEHGRYDQDASTLKYVTHLREVAGRRADSSDARNAHTRYKLAQAQLAEVALAEKAGALCPRDAVREAWGSMMRLVRSWVLSLPGKIQFTVPTLNHVDRLAIEKLVRDGLTDLALGRAQQVCDPGQNHCDSCGALLPKDDTTPASAPSTETEQDNAQ